MWVGWLVVGLAILGGISQGAPGQRWLEHEYSRAAFQWIADLVTKDARDPQQAVSQLLEYVGARVRVPPQGKPISDGEPMEILAAGRGWCDQQANVFIQLARTIPLDSRLVFLQNGPGPSPHTVAEVYLDGAWRVVDPSFGVLIVNGEGKLATREEFAAQPSLFAQLPEAIAKEKFGSSTDFRGVSALYQAEGRIFNAWRGKRKVWLDRCPPPLRRALFYALQDVYLTLTRSDDGLSSPQRELRRARHHALVGRWASAERLFHRVVQQSRDPGVRQDAQFFLGRLYLTQQRFDEAAHVFTVVVNDAPESPWSAFAHASLGQIYETQGELLRAIEEYERSGMVDRDVGIWRRVQAMKVRLNLQRVTWRSAS